MRETVFSIFWRVEREKKLKKKKNMKNHSCHKNSCLPPPKNFSTLQWWPQTYTFQILHLWISTVIHTFEILQFFSFILSGPYQIKKKKKILVGGALETEIWILNTFYEEEEEEAKGVKNKTKKTKLSKRREVSEVKAVI